jgi:hypothetical protein
MAIYAPSIDYSSTANAITNKYNAKRMEIGVDYGKLSLQSDQLSKKSLDLQQKQIDLNRQNMWMDFALGAAQIGAQAWQAARDKTEQSQLDGAKNNIFDISQELTDIIVDDYKHKRTVITTGEDGKAKVDWNPDMQSWYEGKIAEIDNSKDMDSVKAYRKNALNSLMEGATTQLLTVAMNDADAVSEAQYQQGLTKAMQSDMANGGTDMGRSIIYARDGLSKAMKDVQFAAYEETLGYNRSKETVLRTARLEGMTKATELAHSLVGQYGIMEEDAQAFIASAAKGDAQVKSTLVSDAMTMFTSGLEQGLSPAELYSQLDDTTKGIPEDRKQAMQEAAKASHITWATEQGATMWMNDSNSVDIEYLKEQRDSITKKDGTIYNSIYKGLDDMAQSQGTLYDKKIAALEKTFADADKEQVKMNKVVVDGIKSRLQAGEMSGYEAAEMLNSIGANTKGIEDDFYASELAGELKDLVVPSEYKKIAEKTLDAMDKNNWGYDLKKDEQNPRAAAARTNAWGAIVSLFMATPAKDITADAFSKELDRIVSGYTAETIDAIREVKIDSKDTSEDMFQGVQKLSTIEENADTVYYDTNGKVVWSDPAVEEVFDQVAGQMKNELTNLDIGLLVNTPAVPLTVDGETLPVPMYVLPGEDGRAHLYTVNRENILHSNNGGQTFEVVASATGSDLAKTKLFSEGNKVEYNKVNEIIEKRTVGNATPESMGLMPKAEIPTALQLPLGAEKPKRKEYETPNKKGEPMPQPKIPSSMTMELAPELSDRKMIPEDVRLNRQATQEEVKEIIELYEEEKTEPKVDVNGNPNEVPHINELIEEFENSGMTPEEFVRWKKAQDRRR